MEHDETIRHAIKTPYSAASYFDGCIQVVAFYRFQNDQPIPVPQEIRSWRATKSVTKKEIEQILKNWTNQIPTNLAPGIGSEEVRGIPVGRIFRTMQAKINKDSLVSNQDFQVPTPEEIEKIITARLIPDNWRNSRDFRSHARELRSIKIYLNAVYVGESIQPMREIVDREHVTNESARKIIDQARSHGYLTRADRSVGGLVTNKAKKCAQVMMRASKQTKEKKK